MNVDSPAPITHMEWCAGYGGIHLGLERVIPSLRLLALSEIEAYACANLVQKMEAGLMDPAPIWTDCKTFPVAEFSGLVDIFSAGFPCQPFSCAGKRAADEDPRHLWPYILAAVIAMRPGVVFLENVEGIISAKLGGDGWTDPAGTSVLLHVCRELERVGYAVQAGIFSAAEVGASHRRKRVFILGILADTQSEDGRSEQQAGGARRGWAGPSRNGATVAESARIGRGEGRTESGGEQGGYDAAERGSAMGEADISGCEQQRRAVAIRPELASAQCAGGYLPPFPPGPGELDAWRTILAERPDLAPAVEPAIRGVADGPANRVDRLRLCGNGVVPATAAKAFVMLFSQPTGGQPE